MILASRKYVEQLNDFTNRFNSESEWCRAMYNSYMCALCKMYSKRLKKKRNIRNVFSCGERGIRRRGARARREGNASRQRRCMKLQIFRIPTNRYASPAYTRRLFRSSARNLKYEIYFFCPSCSTRLRTVSWFRARGVLRGDELRMPRTKANCSECKQNPINQLANISFSLKLTLIDLGKRWAT